MAASQLPPPGSKFGPCETECQHRDCACTRDMAAQLCRFCGKQIGYEVAFYNDPCLGEHLVHAVCLEKYYEGRTHA